MHIGIECPHCHGYIGSSVDYWPVTKEIWDKFFATKESLWELGQSITCIPADRLAPIDFADEVRERRDMMAITN